MWLLVDYTDGFNPLVDPEPNDGTDAVEAWTVGHNGYDHTGIDEWQFVGWNWEQDCFCEGSGEVVAWAPMPSLEVE